MDPHTRNLLIESIVLCFFFFNLLFYAKKPSIRLNHLIFLYAELFRFIILAIIIFKLNSYLLIFERQYSTKCSFYEKNSHIDVRIMYLRPTWVIQYPNFDCSLCFFRTRFAMWYFYIIFKTCFISDAWSFLCK